MTSELTRLKKIESTLMNVVKIQRAQGVVLATAVSRLSRLDARRALGLPAATRALHESRHAVVA
jgi:hypothetical protein